MIPAHLLLCCLALSCLALAPPAAAQSSFDCLMDPAETVSVGSPAAGILDEVYVRRGDMVRRGDLLARLDSTLEAATVDLLRSRAASTRLIDTQSAQLEMLNRRVERVRVLRERGVVTEEALEVVEAEKLASESLLAQAEIAREIAVMETERAEVALAQREIRSPMDAVVLERGRAAGEYVGSNDHVLRLVRLDPLQVEAFLPIARFGTVAPGQMAEVRPAAPVGGSHMARVISVDRVFDAASGTFGVQLELRNPGGLLPGGHRCTLILPDS